MNIYPLIANKVETNPAVVNTYPVGRGQTYALQNA